MAEPVKFTFDRAFDGGAKSRFDEEIDALRQEMDSVRKQSYEEGLATGHAEAMAGIEKATQEILTQVTQGTHALFSQHAQLEERLKAEMVQLSYAIASKLAPTLIRNQPMVEIEKLISDCLSMARKEPRIVVRVSPDLMDTVADHIDALKTASAFAGDVVLIDDTSLGFQDCKVEWPDGGLERRFTDIQSEVQDAVQRYVMAQNTTALQQQETPTPASADEIIEPPVQAQ